jgi:hypothetical protein
VISLITFDSGPARRVPSSSPVSGMLIWAEGVAGRTKEPVCCLGLVRLCTPTVEVSLVWLPRDPPWSGVCCRAVSPETDEIPVGIGAVCAWCIVENAELADQR